LLEIFLLAQNRPLVLAPNELEQNPSDRRKSGGLRNPSIGLTIKTGLEFVDLIAHATDGRIIVTLPKQTLRLERVWELRSQTPILVVSGAIMLAVAVVDWWMMPYVSLDFSTCSKMGRRLVKRVLCRTRPTL
jgi:hypothetical protein